MSYVLPYQRDFKPKRYTLPVRLVRHLTSRMKHSLLSKDTRNVELLLCNYEYACNELMQLTVVVEADSTLHPCMQYTPCRSKAVILLMTTGKSRPPTTTGVDFEP